MRSSTSAPEIGFPLARVPDQDLIVRFRISPAEVAARRKLLVKQQSDPAWIAETLEALPAATLAVLHLLVEHQGVVMQDRLCTLARDQFGMSEDDCIAAAAPAIERILAVPLTTHDGRIALGIVHPAVALVAPLVAGLELLDLPADRLVPTEAAVRNPRTFLAVCVATRQVDIKITNEGRPHRSAIKRLAKEVGIDEGSLEAMLLTAIGIGVVSPETEVLRAELDALAEAAQGRYPHSSFVAASQQCLARGPLHVQALIQSVLRRDLDAVGYVGRDAFAYLPGFTTGTIDGAEAVTVRAIEGTAAGHVTPSFEVFLPPESRLLDIVQVGACCEWDRLDRVIVGRITKASVTRAAAAGSSAAQILEQLAAASRHPIPQNVEAAIRDWAGSVIAATIASGQVVVVDPGARGRVAPALAELGARELAPGVFLVDRNETLRDITAALARAGVHHREAPVVRPRSPMPRELAPVVLSPAAMRLRARVSAWRRGEPFEGKRDDFVEQQRAAHDASTGELREVEQQLGRWVRQHHAKVEPGDPAHHALVAILTTLPPATRARLLVTSPDLEELLRQLAKLSERRGRSGPSGESSPPKRREQRRPPPLLWQEEGLRERLQEAAKRGDALALQLASGIRYVEIDRTLRRGNAWMVLGEDLTNGEAIAVKIEDVQAIAALPDNLDAYDLGDGGIVADDDDGDDDDELDDDDDVGATPRKPWQPAPGQPPPPGHLPCPCGSGERYRNCCRKVASA